LTVTYIVKKTASSRKAPAIPSFADRVTDTDIHRPPRIPSIDDEPVGAPSTRCAPANPQDAVSRARDTLALSVETAANVIADAAANKEVSREALTAAFDILERAGLKKDAIPVADPSSMIPLSFAKEAFNAVYSTFASSTVVTRSPQTDNNGRMESTR